MNKKEAKDRLGLNNKGLACALCISESYVRNSKEFSDTHTALINCLIKVDELEADIQRHLNTIDRVTLALLDN